MSLAFRAWLSSVVILLLTAMAAHAADDAPAPQSQQSLEELRNTVVNLLQALVDKGLLTREQAQQLVKQAQDKAAADAAASAAKNAAQAKEDENAIRVPYVPQIVKDQISKQVESEIKPAVVADVVQTAKTERWGVPAALPEWLSRVSVFGDVTIRGQSDLYPNDNGQVFDFNAINTAGGLTKAAYPFLDTTEDRYRLRLRARLGVDATLSDTIHAVIRLASGSLTQIAGSESQTLGTYGNRYTVGIDEGYIVWDSTAASTGVPINTLEGGRLGNPWFTPTELVYARDLTFEGVADTLRIPWGTGGPDASHAYLTVGAFPMLEVPLQATQDKWLLGAQIGVNLRFADGNDHLRLAGAYYDFLHVSGQLNAPDSILLNYTAPAFVQNGNTMFDIANSTTASGTNLFALAAHFRIADVALRYDHDISRYSLGLAAEATRNIGYNLPQIEALTGRSFTSKQDQGYVAEVSFGDPNVDRLWRWRAAVGYRYVQSDSVLDAWTDADFHEGGTNALGYYFWASLGLAPNTWVRLRYLSANEITGPRYGLDIVQLDVNTRF